MGGDRSLQMETCMDPLALLSKLIFPRSLQRQVQCYELFKCLLDVGYACESKYDYKMYSKLLELGLIRRKWSYMNGKKVRVLVPYKRFWAELLTICEKMLQH